MYFPHPRNGVKFQPIAYAQQNRMSNVAFSVIVKFPRQVWFNFEFTKVSWIRLNNFVYVIRYIITDNINKMNKLYVMRCPLIPLTMTL